MWMSAYAKTLDVTCCYLQQCLTRQKINDARWHLSLSRCRHDDDALVGITRHLAEIRQLQHDDGAAVELDDALRTINTQQVTGAVSLVSKYHLHL